jgi:hypothetical protein
VLGVAFSVDAALNYLRNLEIVDSPSFADALSYIRRAPPEIRTPVREAVNPELFEIAERLVPQTGLEPVTPSLRIPDRGISPSNDDYQKEAVYHIISIASLALVS